MKRTMFFKLVVALVLLSASNLVFAQNCDYIKEHIERIGRCQSVSIADNDRTLMLYDGNGAYYTNMPEKLVTALQEMNADSVFIRDITVTANGRWLILYEANSVLADEIPQGLINVLKNLPSDEVIYSVTFNEYDQWMVITEKQFWISEKDLYSVVMEDMEKFGSLVSASMSNEVLSLTYEDGCNVLGQVEPSVATSLQEAIDKTEIDINVLKIVGDKWFFADRDGACEYNF